MQKGHTPLPYTARNPLTRKVVILFVSLFITTTLNGCSGEKRPFEVQYTSPNDATITYKGNVYQLNRFRPASNLPFDYEFENDGDLNLVVDSKEYEIESPYDIDKKKKKTKTVKKKKTSKPKKKTTK